MNNLGSRRCPFTFIISYDKSKVHVFTGSNAAEQAVYYSFPGWSNAVFSETDSVPEITNVVPVSRDRYMKAFDYITGQERTGNSYLANLTFPSGISCSSSLAEIFSSARALFKLLYKDEFTVFSPERFVRIEHDVISTCPMKGTISAEIADAEKIILADQKEIAEHVTVVDLLRNDLGRIGHDVRVERFRYVDEIIAAGGRRILQVSSLINANLDRNWHARIGGILSELLPAGSVTGAPKKKTCEIISAAEQYDRGYYTGIMGYYDGNVLDSAVMIRFIEKNGEELIYKSGGGITIYSNAESEYAELKEKIYVPVC